MEYKLDRVVRPPGTVTGTLSPPTAKDYECLFVEGTIQLAEHDADLNIVFPGGQRAVLQWRTETPSLDLCFDPPVDVFNDGPDMEPAPAAKGRPEQHVGVVQLVIPLLPEYAEKEAKS